MKNVKKAMAFVLAFVLCASLCGCLPQDDSSDMIRVPPIASKEDDYHDKVDEIVALLDQYYVDGYDTAELGDYLAEAAVAAAGDRWSYYYTAEEYAERLEDENNAYVGIGVTVQQMKEDDPGFTVTEVSPNGSAYEAGVQVNDIIIAVDGQDALELGMDGVKKTIRGEEGSDVTITVLRGRQTIDIVITRKLIMVEVVLYELLQDNVGYIKVVQFSNDVAKMTISAIEDLISQGATGLVFDMRFNPGGFKKELVELLDYLLPSGALFRSVDYQGKEEVDSSDAKCLEMPMAVLVNGDSYSAAEFFAAALQEYEWATIVGTQTVGKANYQQTFKLSDGSAVSISTGHYQTPKGVTLEGIGVTPDIVVEVDDETYLNIYYEKLDKTQDEQLQAAINALKE